MLIRGKGWIGPSFLERAMPFELFRIGKRLFGILIPAFVSSFLFVNCLSRNLSALDASNPSGFFLSGLLFAHGPLFLAVGVNCSFWTSEDGMTWEAHAQANMPNCGTTSSLNAAAYGNNTYVIVGSLGGAASGCGIWTSNNGIDWKQRACPSGNTTPLMSVEFSSGNNSFVAGGTAPAAGQCPLLVSSGDYTSWSQSFYVGSCAVSDSIRSIVDLKNNNLLASKIGGSVEYPSSSDGGLTWPVAAGNPAGLAAGSATHLEAAGSGRTIVYGFNGGNGALSYGVNPISGGWAGAAVVSSMASSINAGSAIPSLGKFLGVSTNCGLVGSFDDGTSFQPFTSMGTGCSSIAWTAIAGVRATGFYVVGGVATNTAFGWSLDGSPSTWTVLTVTGSNAVNDIVVRQ